MALSTSAGYLTEAGLHDCTAHQKKICSQHNKTMTTFAKESNNIGQWKTRLRCYGLMRPLLR